MANQRSETIDQEYGLGARKRGNSTIAIVVGVLAFIIFVFGIVYYAVFGLVPGLAKGLGSMLFGGGGSAQAASSAALQPVDCSGTSIPKIFLPGIKYSANRFLGGDQAVIVALISVESNFHPQDISNTGAVGIAQFTGPTARGTQSAGLFKGLKIIDVPRANFPTVTPAEKQSFISGYLNIDGRFQPNPSFDAAAYKMGFAIKKYGGLREGYAQGYHRFANDSQKADAYAAADRLVGIYDKVNANGGCQALKAPAGTLGGELRKLTNTSF